jgi:hypothetical protein
VSLPLVPNDSPDERRHRTQIAAALNELVSRRNRQDLPVVTYSAAITFDASSGSVFIVTATNGVAFSIEAPIKLVVGQRITAVIKNSSGGALGAITWNAIFKKTAFTSPANGFSRSIEFVYDGTNLVQVFQGATDVPN